MSSKRKITKKQQDDCWFMLKSLTKTGDHWTYDSGKKVTNLLIPKENQLKLLIKKGKTSKHPGKMKLTQIR